MRKQSTSVIFFLSLLVISCAETQVIQQNEPKQTNPVKQAGNEIQLGDLKESLDYDPDKYLIKLGDNCWAKNNDLPDELQSEATIEQQKTTEDETGYRIQLVSTNKRETAEKIISDFNEWIFSSETISYKAEAYLIYRQPYFRVHIGDFKTRIQANEFVKLIKRRFSDAWIIQDQINEELVPDFVK